MIRVQNVYYMLAYAFQCLNERDEKRYSEEQFDYVADLFASILANGVAKQIKKGLFKEYVTYQEELSRPRGRIRLSDTINRMAAQQKTTVCDVDEYVENMYSNQILKSVLILLIKSSDVKETTKKKLKTFLPFFQQIGETDMKHVGWNRITYTRNNSSYRMMMYICQLIIDGMIISDGKTNEFRLKEFIDDQKMHTLYEKFILEYYRKHYPQFKVTQSQIDWNLDDDVKILLPKMKSDIMIEYKGRTLIIDAKYYKSSLQTNSLFGNKTVHSHNLYQIYTYVKNKDRFSDKSVSGMLLYANVDGQNPNVDYMMDGNKISVKTLDLNCSFSVVKQQLDAFANSWLNYIGEANEDRAPDNIIS